MANVIIVFMFKRARIDDNQKQIVSYLRKVGATVQSLATIGSGCPDILVGYGGVNYLFEIKRPGKRKQLTSDQITWHDKWRGYVVLPH